jgi:MarR family transcriptional regulator, organic hydroperoxide resistance regulator
MMHRTKTSLHRSGRAQARHRQAALHVLMQFRQAANSAKQHFRWVGDQCGISGVHVWALWELGEAPGARVSDLARALAIHQSTASNLLEKLKREGLVRRERGRGDQRVARLHVTPAGAALLKRAPTPVRAMLLEALYRMPEPALRRLARLLGDLLRRMKVDRSASREPLSD